MDIMLAHVEKSFGEAILQTAGFVLALWAHIHVAPHFTTFKTWLTQVPTQQIFLLLGV